MNDPDLMRTVAVHLRSPYLCNWDRNVADALADWLDAAAHNTPADPRAVATARALAASLGLNLDECTTWACNPVVAETRTMLAVADGYPVVPGHTLIIARNHVVRFEELTTAQLVDLRDLVGQIRAASGTDSLTLAVNDGFDAGRTVDRFHMHAIPRRRGDVPDPRGGIRAMFYPSPADDPWIIARRQDSDPAPRPTGRRVHPPTCPAGPSCYLLDEPDDVLQPVGEVHSVEPEPGEDQR
jgi:diadenosine tetraphosphate (Ap4A) HIT family hydrolase